MARTKQRKMGDRIFYEKYNGTIGTATIKKIEPVESPFDKKAISLVSERIIDCNLMLNLLNNVSKFGTQQLYV